MAFLKISVLDIPSIRGKPFCTLLVKHLISQQLKTKASPLFQQWLRNLENVLHMERVHYTFSNRDTIFLKTWQLLFDKVAAGCSKVYRLRLTPYELEHIKYKIS